MKLLWQFLTCILCFLILSNSATAQSSRIEERIHYAYDDALQYWIYIPANYNTQNSYPLTIFPINNPSTVSEFILCDFLILLKFQSAIHL